MNDRDFITSIRDQCNVQLGTVVVPPGGGGGGGGGTAPPAADFNLGWSDGNPLLAQAATQTYSVTPSAEWLALAEQNAQQIASGGIPRGAAVATLSVQGGYNPAAGVTPPFVLYTIGGVSLEFGGSNQNWSFDPRFPNGFPRPTGPFNVTLEQLDAQHQPIGPPYGVAISLNHTP